MIASSSDKEKIRVRGDDQKGHMKTLSGVKYDKEMFRWKFRNNNA